jgi:NCAIR mutase (PurE)-related protein
VDHLAAILEQVQEKGRHMLLTRLLPEQYAALSPSHRAAVDYDPISRTGFFGGAHELRTETRIAVVAAGLPMWPSAAKLRARCVSTASRLRRLGT